MKSKVVKIAKDKISLFAFVGVINTVVDIILLNLLRVATDTTTDQKGKLILVNICSASTVALLSFYLNRKYVFKSPETQNHMFLPFLLVTLSSIFILQSIIIAIALHSFDPLAELSMEIAKDLHIPVFQNFSFNFYEANIAKLFATLFSMIWNYVWYNKVIFRKTD